MGCPKSCKTYNQVPTNSTEFIYFLNCLYSPAGRAPDQTARLLTQVSFHNGAKEFSPSVNFQSRLFRCSSSLIPHSHTIWGWQIDRARSRYCPPHPHPTPTKKKPIRVEGGGLCPTLHTCPRSCRSCDSRLSDSRWSPEGCDRGCTPVTTKNLLQWPLPMTDEFTVAGSAMKPSF